MVLKIGPSPDGHSSFPASSLAQCIYVYIDARRVASLSLEAVRAETISDRLVALFLILFPRLAYGLMASSFITMESIDHEAESLKAPRKRERALTIMP